MAPLPRHTPYAVLQVPSAWFFVDKIPKSDIGKLQRRKLSDYFLAMVRPLEC